MSQRELIALNVDDPTHAVTGHVFLFDAEDGSPRAAGFMVLTAKSRADSPLDEDLVRKLQAAAAPALSHHPETRCPSGARGR